jgi:hypothetical protein
MLRQAYACGWCLSRNMASVCCRLLMQSARSRMQRGMGITIHAKVKLLAASSRVSRLNCAKANPPSLFELRRGHLAIHPCSKLQGILAKANKKRMARIASEII